MRAEKIFLFTALFFFCMSLGVAWYGRMSVAKQAAMITMRARVEAAEEFLSSNRRREAASLFLAATAEYQKGVAKPGYYIGMSDDFLAAGNSFWKQGQFRAALAAYHYGLEHDPYSISLLTSAGFCAFRLGDSELAVDFLKRSQKIYSKNKRVNKVLRNLKKRSKEKDLK